MSAGEGTCPVCGGPVRVVGDPVEGTMHYEAALDPTVDEALRHAVRIVARSENARRSREGQDFLHSARKALGHG